MNGFFLAGTPLELTSSRSFLRLAGDGGRHLAGIVDTGTTANASFERRRSDLGEKERHRGQGSPFTFQSKPGVGGQL